MKLKYKKSTHWQIGLNKPTKVKVTLSPEREEINCYEDWEQFLFSLFEDNKKVSDIEFAYSGKQRIVRAEFRGGAFNENPIQYEKSTSSKFEKHQLMMDIIGAVTSNGTYFLKAKKDEIKIAKSMEVMG